jgi:hypothetical protein
VQATTNRLIYKSPCIINNYSLLFVDQSVSHHLPMMHYGFDPLEHGLSFTPANVKETEECALEKEKAVSSRGISS